MLKKTEQELRQELYDDPRGITAQLQEIYHDEKSPWHKAYLNSGDPRHDEAIQRVSILSEAKYDNQPYNPEVMPVVTKTAETQNPIQEK